MLPEDCTYREKNKVTRVKRLDMGDSRGENPLRLSGKFRRPGNFLFSTRHYHPYQMLTIGFTISIARGWIRSPHTPQNGLIFFFLSFPFPPRAHTLGNIARVTPEKGPLPSALGSL